MVDALITGTAILIAIAFLLSLYRFFKGPTTADRVAAFDVLTIVAITGIVLVALIAERGIYLDVALVYALLAFLGAIAVARYLERGF